MNKLRKYITPIILVFALFAINGAEFLHHHDFDGAHKDNKCQACLVNKTLHSFSFVESSSSFDLNHSYIEFLSEETNKPQQNYFNNLSGRSPPSL